MKSSVLPLTVMLSITSISLLARGHIGADVCWRTYEAEEMKTTGTVLGPRYEPWLVETESSGQECVKLTDTGQYVEFTVQSPANAMVVRYSLPDAPTGGGIDSTLNVYQNGTLIGKLPVTSRRSWLYGTYPFSNEPGEGKPRNFSDEARLKGLALLKGDVLRLEKVEQRAAYCIVDLVDLEQVPPPLSAPIHALSLTDFGASGKGEVDDTEALRQCIAAAARQAKTVWVPAGTYKLTGDIVLPAGLSLQGAGMWHTTFTGEGALYGRPDRRVRLRLEAGNVHLADFAIVGELNYRKDDEPNDGIVGTHSDNSVLARIWVEHTKVGMWFYNSDRLIIEGCRFRNTVADGINLCGGVRRSVIQNCTARGTGDDCYAIWPAPPDQAGADNRPVPGSNAVRQCTGQLPFLANGAAIYGGADNRIENCLFTDISPGCGILLSTTFPTANEELKIDHNFSGITVVRGCELRRCGGFDHEWAWRAALEFCLDRRSISGVKIIDVEIQDSLSNGLRIVAPGGRRGQGRLSNAHLENVRVHHCGLAAVSRHDLWVREDVCGSLAVSHSQLVDIQNSSTNFTIIRE